MRPLSLICRRRFLERAGAAGACLAWAAAFPRAALAASSPRWPIISFSKAFQDLGPEETAKLMAEAGYDGIECPVRRGGHVLAERAEEDLPRMVEALAKQGLKLHIMATDIRDATEPGTEKLLRTASKLGIRLYRLGSTGYRTDQPIPDQWADLRAKLKDLAALNRELGLCAGFQNHSGNDRIGAPVWDLYEILKDLDREHLGIFFDLGHATVEGGYAWPIHAKLMEPFYKAVYVKDFSWQKSDNRWSAAWCPLGQGMIQRAFFATLRKSNYAGPISLHVEYPVGKGDELLQTLKRDLATLKSWLGA